MSCSVYMTEDHITIFAHGLGGNKKSGERLYKNIIGGKIIGENGPDVNFRHQTCLAQDADINIVIEQIKENSEKNLTLSGISKGAATMINTIGTLSEQKPELLQHVKAVIIDSPFISPESVVHNVIRSKFPRFFQGIIDETLKTTPLRFLTKYALKKLYPAYDPKKITPLKSIQELWRNVDKNIVIILIHSQKDSLINVNDSRMLYLELKKLGFNNLYFIETTQGAHGKADWGIENDLVLQALHGIYLKHNLPFPQGFNRREKELNDADRDSLFSQLLTFQPTIEEISKKMYSRFYSSTYPTT